MSAQWRPWTADELDRWNTACDQWLAALRELDRRRRERMRLAHRQYRQRCRARQRRR